MVVVLRRVWFGEASTTRHLKESEFGSGLPRASFSIPDRCFGVNHAVLPVLRQPPRLLAIESVTYAADSRRSTTGQTSGRTLRASLHFFGNQ
jgi:hypothetical protein